MKPVCWVTLFVLLCVLVQPGGGEPLSVDEEGDSGHPRPLWEFGLFNGVARIPDYRGSDEYTTYVVPIPYVVYRGEVVRAGRDGVKGILLRMGRLQTEMSLQGSPPVSRDNRAREGMYNVGGIIEIGPALKYDFLDRASPNNFFIRGAVRGVLAFDVHNDYRSSARGVRMGLGMVYGNRTLFKDSRITFGARCSVDFASSEYTDYVYGVPAAYALPTRSEYRGSGGYVGFSASTYATKALRRKLWASVFLSWSNVDGAVFADSPLVETENNTVLGCALIWSFKESRTLAPVRPEAR